MIAFSLNLFIVKYICKKTGIPQVLTTQTIYRQHPIPLDVRDVRDARNMANLPQGGDNTNYSGCD